jgi:hypothetical protein
MTNGEAITLHKSSHGGAARFPASTGSQGKERPLRHAKRLLHGFQEGVRKEG